MMCLAVRDLSNVETLQAFYQLKLWAITHAFPSDRTLDRVIEYFKWLGKMAQALFLGVKPPESQIQPVLSANGSLLPFVGPFQFISDFYIEGRRRRTMSSAEARALAQIGNLPRALPYPSRDQVTDTIAKSVAAFQQQNKTTKQARKNYAKGLTAQYTALGRPKAQKTHVSMVNSASLEYSRTDGGRSKLLVKLTRSYTDKIVDLDELEHIIDKVDQFGDVILSRTTFEMAKVLLRTQVYLRTPTIGDILYLTVQDIPGVWSENLNQRAVPKQLGPILNLTASMLIREIGDYSPRPEFHCGIMVFPEGSLPIFALTGKIRVRAGVSIEAGLKARLTTAASVAFAHLSQLPSNALRKVLAKDPFMKVGFEESEKLWEVLKAYRAT
jgi:hypothetical protein